MAGYHDEEIAERLGCSRRTVMRKLILISKCLASGDDAMSLGSRIRLEDLPAELVERIDRVCDRFEAEWKAGELPQHQGLSDPCAAQPSGR